MPSAPVGRGPRHRVANNPFAWFLHLHGKHGAQFKASRREDAHPRAWPQGFDPKNDPVFARNVIDLPNVPPEKAYAALLDATRWPELYENARDVKLPAGTSKLELGMTFEWVTFGTKQKTTVVELEPNRVVGWYAKMPGNEAYHRWLFEPNGQGGTRLVTEECNRGLLAKLDGFVMNKAMHASHQLWLEGLAEHLG